MKPRSEPGAGERTILIIDDTPSNLKVAVECLEERGFRVVIACDGEEGLARAELVRPDLILLDVMMPGPDGFETCRRLKAHAGTWHIPVIFMTSLTETADKVGAFAAGAVDYVTKPLQVDELVARVATHLALSAERHSAQRLLQLLSYALDKIGESILLMGGKSPHFLYANEGAALALGYGRDELTGGMGMHDIDPAWSMDAETDCRPLPDTQSIASFEAMHRRRDGSEFPVEVRSSLFDFDGEVYKLAICRDVSERKHTDALLHKREQEFRALAENTPDIIARFDRAGRCLYANPALEGILAVPLARLLHHTTSEFAPGWADAERFNAMIRDVVASGERTESEFVFVSRETATPTPVWHHVRFVPERGEDGRVASVLAVGRDISALKDAERRLEASNAQLRDLTTRRENAREEERRRIAREIHDELGQHLTALRMGISLVCIQFGDDNPGLVEQLQRSIGITDKTIQVVRQLASRLRPAALDMGLVSALEWLAADFARNTGIQYRLRLPAHKVVLDDDRATAVFRLVQESLTNVARHAGASRVEIALERAEGAYVIEVSDNGKGFDPTRPRKNTFGLLGMRERALMLGSDVGITSAPGSGTTIRVSIPTRRASERA